MNFKDIFNSSGIRIYIKMIRHYSDLIIGSKIVHIVHYIECKSMKILIKSTLIIKIKVMEHQTVYIYLQTDINPK